jgi:hypothetical protein
VDALALLLLCHFSTTTFSPGEQAVKRIEGQMHKAVSTAQDAPGFRDAANSKCEVALYNPRRIFYAALPQ